MSMTNSGCTGLRSAQRPRIEVCNRPLARDRFCCHVKGHLTRHSHTWNTGNARYGSVNGYLTDMETGEVVAVDSDDTSRVIELGRAGNSASDPRRVLELYLPGFNDTVKPLDPPEGSKYRWHYQTLAIALGTDESGRDVEFDRHTGKIHRIYSVSERREAILCARRLGAAKTARKFNIPDATIRSWVNRERVGRGSRLVDA
jgi:hypothetical protein